MPKYRVSFETEADSRDAVIDAVMLPVMSDIHVDEIPDDDDVEQDFSDADMMLPQEEN